MKTAQTQQTAEAEHPEAAGSKARLAASMVIFGTIGIFVHYIGMPSALIAMVRGLLGFGFLLVFMRIRRQAFAGADVRRNLWKLVFSGACIGFNWILLFEAYRYTTVAVATLCYYMQPVIVTVLSPLVLRERMTARKLVCVLTALFGMTFVSGVWSGGAGSGSLTGILLGLGAAALYSTVVLTNKKMTPMPAAQQTMIQLLCAGLVVAPYALMTIGGGTLHVTPLSVGLLLFVGIFHTGFAYELYFGEISRLPAQTCAILSYIDPVVAVLLSALLLREPLGVSGVAGAVLILGSALISEWKRNE